MLDASRAGVRNILLHSVGPYIDVARNQVLQKFYQELDEEYFLFFDSDMVAMADDITKLMTYASPDRIVSGVYWNNFPDWGMRPVAGRWSYNERQKCESIIPIDPRILKDVDDDGLVKVDGCGAGFLLFHRSLLDKMVEAFGWPMPWFAEFVLERNQQWVGEDYIFCLRAALVGVPSYVVPEVQIGHMKTQMLTGESWLPEK